ncbi:hypothetical protein ACFOEK_14205 [Litoribrevibacter euphylliae]|uniref:Prepilin-type N-terminal cleavage/methylation domain-containing protein n=1 Tax=Litoribrevibacter euphylliae TaxID=1834034 RepID=A0ABV7HKZ4_9GAMM
MKYMGFSLVEMMVVLLLATLLSLSCSEWFLSISRLYKAQQLLIESQEVGRFSLAYLNKSLAKAGAGLDTSEAVLKFQESGVSVQYQADLPTLGVSLNCLGNRAKGNVVEDTFLVDDYDYGGKELKCMSSGRGDWLTEGIEYIQYEVAVDQGSYINERFILGEFDGIPDAYVSEDEFDEAVMRPVALRVFLATYRPTKLNPQHLKYWKQEASSEQIKTDFTTLVLLPNT